MTVAVNILWFRHGLRLHDNPSLLEALKPCDDCPEEEVKLLPLFIFDGESAGTKLVGYNRMQFLLESLADLDRQFRAFGSQLYMFRGKPTHVFSCLKAHLPIRKICYEQDCEPIWKNRDRSVESLCADLKIEAIEKVSHTLWDPALVMQTNGGIPPLTYQMFLHTVQILGPPPRPVGQPSWENVKFAEIPEAIDLTLEIFAHIPTPEDFGLQPEGAQPLVKFHGGETQALVYLKERLVVEEGAFKQGYYLPNQAMPNILERSKSISPHLRFGCLSVRKFYWNIHDLHQTVQAFTGYGMPGGPHITGQLIWREYFYTMSVNNPNYGQMDGNDICLKIPWAAPAEGQIERWKAGKTGFPLIDAAMRQLLSEGWLHHTLRNTVANFLTRGSLWLSWEHGFQHFLQYLLDADWSVCAGNWMWVSSSAFEKLLDTSLCTCPVSLARRLDPTGEYIKRYVPELARLPAEYVHEPWKAPLPIQKESNCVLGVDYPHQMIDLNKAMSRNINAMKALRNALVADGVPDKGPPHCRPSNEVEIRNFFWIAD